MFDFRVDKNCNLYYGGLFVTKISRFFSQRDNYSTDNTVNSQLSVNYLGIMLQKNLIRESLNNTDRTKALGLTEEMLRHQHQDGYKKRISEVLERLQHLPFREMKFSCELYYDQKNLNL